MSGLSVELGDDDELLVLSLAGELDFATVPDFEAAYLRRTDGQRATVVDLRHVKFVDSSGIAALLKIRRLDSEQGRRLALIRGPSNLQRVFALSGLNAAFRFVDHPRDVLQAEAR